MVDCSCRRAGPGHPRHLETRAAVPEGGTDGLSLALVLFVITAGLGGWRSRRTRRILVQVRPGLACLSRAMARQARQADWAGKDFELVKKIRDGRHLLDRGKPRDGLADKCAARGTVEGLIVDTIQIGPDDWVPAVVPSTRCMCRMLHRTGPAGVWCRCRCMHVQMFPSD